MGKLDKLHLWMITPLVLMQLFIGSSYWIGFPHSSWSIHVHFWTVTAWYVLLIVQPYFISKGNAASHRTVGILGVAVAGGVGFTALSLLPNTVAFGRFAEADPAQFAPFTPEFFYAIALTEFILGIAFLVAVYKAVIHRRSKFDHATWMMSSAFIMLYPAIGRGVQNASIMLNGFENYYTEIVVIPVLVSVAIIIGSLLIIASRHGMLRHPAIVLTIAVNLIPPILQIFPGLVEPMNEGIKAIFTMRFE